jgi:intracellular multiplication protein IcmD
MSDDNGTIGEIASTVTSSTPELTTAITAGSEAAGAAQAVVSIEKFKVHKDNPTQLP